MKFLFLFLIIGMSGRSVGCETMYRFTISNDVSGLLDILKNYYTLS